MFNQNLQQKIQTLVYLFPVSYKHIGIVPTNPNGNCFFECVARCCPKLHNIPNKNPIVILRELVANTISNYDSNTAQTIQRWRELWIMAKKHNNMQLLHEFHHVKDIQDIPLQQSLQKSELSKINKYIMNNTFWAEEFTINTLSKHLNICFVIIDELAKKIQKPICSNPITEQTTYIIVYLDKGQHYSLIIFKNLCRMIRQDLPQEIKNEIRKHFPI